VEDFYDNALTETINGLYKAVVIHRRSWPRMENEEMAPLTWANWYNHHRLLSLIGYRPSAPAEADYYQFTRTSSIAA
jgi:transposase InsO family protein